jgi:hypothetical protein
MAAITLPQAPGGDVAQAAAVLGCSPRAFTVKLHRARRRLTGSGCGRFSATMPHAARGKAVSLRVKAADAGGSGIAQTTMTAYRG